MNSPYGPPTRATLSQLSESIARSADSSTGIETSNSDSALLKELIDTMRSWQLTVMPNTSVDFIVATLLKRRAEVPTTRLQGFASLLRRHKQRTLAERVEAGLRTAAPKTAQPAVKIIELSGLEEIMAATSDPDLVMPLPEENAEPHFVEPATDVNWPTPADMLAAINTVKKEAIRYPARKSLQNVLGSPARPHIRYSQITADHFPNARFSHSTLEAALFAYIRRSTKGDPVPVTTEVRRLFNLTAARRGLPSTTAAVQNNLSGRHFKTLVISAVEDLRQMLEGRLVVPEDSNKRFALKAFVELTHSNEHKNSIYLDSVDWKGVITQMSPDDASVVLEHLGVLAVQWPTGFRTAYENGKLRPELIEALLDGTDVATVVTTPVPMQAAACQQLISSLARLIDHAVSIGGLGPSGI